MVIPVTVRPYQSADFKTLHKTGKISHHIAAVLFPVHQDIQAYMDWGKEELFQVIRGEGECAV